MCKGEIKILAQDTEVAVAGHKEARFHYIRRNGLSIGRQLHFVKNDGANRIEYMHKFMGCGIYRATTK